MTTTNNMMTGFNPHQQQQHEEKIIMNNHQSHDGVWEVTKRDLNVGVNAYLAVESIYSSNFRNALNYFSYATAFYVAANNEFFRKTILNNTSDNPIVYFWMIIISLLCLMQSGFIQYDNYKEYKNKKKMFDHQRIKLRLSQDQTLLPKRIIYTLHFIILAAFFILAFIVGIVQQ